MLRVSMFALCLLTLTGCNPSSQTEVAEPSAEPQEGAESASSAPNAQELEDGSRLYGSALEDGRAMTPMGDLLGEPANFNGQVVKTEGVITQVCQRMGCWMELRASADSDAGIRVPMAGHSFFLPRDVAGRTAVVQGELSVSELPEDHQEHLAEEGAELATVDVQIEATGVIVR